ncbi:MAG: hypothetical protein QME50_07405 [Candidatus Bathyarchaeota archaeon]|nr:hypothetical protein [Candidatus Bathyarchaeota archaeon]
MAMAIGVNPSVKAILTTTKELPQKRISIIIRKTLKRLIVLAFMTENLLFKFIKNYMKIAKTASRNNRCGPGRMKLRN